MTSKTWEYLTEQATDTKGLNTRQITIFEMFNPNGAYAYKKAADAKISQAVDARLVPSGWIIAHGSFNDYHYMQLSKILSRKSHTKRWTVEYHASKMREDADKAIAKLQEVLHAAA